MLTEIKPGGAGFGQRRFIVRNGLAISESQERELRPRINEYPELFPLEPRYPQAGRRGGSRPPGAVGGIVEGGAPGLPIEELIGSNYPGPRPRETGTVLGGVGGLVSGVGASCQPEGDTYPFSGNFNAGQIRVFSSVRIGPPFVITHVTARVNVVHTTTPFLLFVRISDDGDTSQGVNTGGVDLDLNNAAGWNNMTDAHIHSYPQRKFVQGNKYIKIIGNNLDTIAHFLQGGVDFNYL